VLNKLFAESHFLLLPSKAEAFGLVLCEAGSFGVPSLATNVGGIPTIINDDVNGRLFPKDGGIEAYCNYICDLFSKYQTYKDLALSSFNEFEARLNWPVAGKAARKLLEAVI
jgi:glycosyltransferase involved in cell wall biosynthesis